MNKDILPGGIHLPVGRKSHGQVRELRLDGVVIVLPESVTNVSVLNGRGMFVVRGPQYS